MKKTQNNGKDLGFCTNTEHCELAKEHEIFETNGSLSCPECDAPLSPYSETSGKPPLYRNMAIALALLLILGGIGIYLLSADTETSNNSENLYQTPTPVNNSLHGQTIDSECVAGTVFVAAKSYVFEGQYKRYLKKYLQKYSRNQGVENQNTLEIEIQHGFCLQQNEVTVADFKQFLAAATDLLSVERLDALNTNISTLENSSPIDNISKQDAEDYSFWLKSQNDLPWALPELGQWLVAVTLYGEQSPVISTFDNLPAPITSLSAGMADNLLGNLREWSADSCSNGRFQLLGKNYISGAGIDMAYCQYPNASSPGIGFRLMYHLNGED